MELTLAEQRIIKEAILKSNENGTMPPYIAAKLSSQRAGVLMIVRGILTKKTSILDYLHCKYPTLLRYTRYHKMSASSTPVKPIRSGEVQYSVTDGTKTVIENYQANDQDAPNKIMRLFKGMGAPPSERKTISAVTAVLLFSVVILLIALVTSLLLGGRSSFHQPPIYPGPQVGQPVYSTQPPQQQQWQQAPIPNPQGPGYPAQGSAQPKNQQIHPNVQAQGPVPMAQPAVDQDAAL